ncbi:hypothetical protein [uncultured Vagococcus sp.]|nr:hypothetical protein [uncultured Vagococcus sp.]
MTSIILWTLIPFLIKEKISVIIMGDILTSSNQLLISMPSPLYFQFALV